MPHTSSALSGSKSNRKDSMKPFGCPPWPGCRNPPRRAANRLPRLRWHATTARRAKTAKADAMGIGLALGRTGRTPAAYLTKGTALFVTLRDVHIRAWTRRLRASTRRHRRGC